MNKEKIMKSAREQELNRQRISQKRKNRVIYREKEQKNKYLL